MYGLSKDKDLGFMLNKDLLQVCVGLHEVILNFDGDMSILTQCTFEVIAEVFSPGGTPNSQQAALGSPSSFLPLLGAKIVAVENVGDQRLILRFSEGTTVILHEDNSNFESYQITAPGQEIIV